MNGSSDEWSGRLTAGLKESESWDAADGAPDLAWFESLVFAHKRRLRRKRRGELAVFLLAAVWLVGGVLVLLARSPQWFLVMQIALVAAGALPWGYRRYQERRAGRP